MRDDLGDQVPRWRGSTIGRDGEVAEAKAALVDGPGRLVSLTGAGGVGKTRLAVDVARAVAPALEGGATFVALAGLTDPEDVPVATAAALGLAASSGEEPLRALANGLGDRAILVVADNFEHLLAAAPVIEELLEACRGLRVLVTTRLPLGLDGEHVIPVEPLALPAPLTGPAADDDLERLVQVSSVQLFLERAAALDDRFGLTVDNAGDIVTACRVSGGSPLALELAAARTRVLSLHQLVDRLEADPLAVLATQEPERDDRHRSLRATIAWTHDLLGRRDQEVLHQLSVFEQGFSLEAAEQVVRSGPRDLVDALEALTGAHLLEASRSAGGDEPRLSMPVPVREFARERLHATGGHEATHARLVDHVLAVAATAAVELESAAEQRWLDRIDRELDQFRAVLGHLRRHDPPTALRLTVDLGAFWLHRGSLAEGRRHLAPALDESMATGIDPSLLAAARAWEGRLAAGQGVFRDPVATGAALAQIELGLASARAEGDVDGQLRCIDFVSHVLILHHDDSGPAVAAIDDGIELARRHDRTWWLAQLLQRAAAFARLRGEPATAAALAGESLAIAQRLGAERIVLQAGTTLYQLPPQEQVGERPDLPMLLDLAARLRHEHVSSAGVVVSLGVEELTARRLASAATCFRQAVVMARDSAYWHAVGYSLVCTAVFASVVEAHETCARMHGAAREAMPVLRRGMLPAHLEAYERNVTRSREALGGLRFDRLADHGANLGGRLAGDEAVAFLDGFASRPAEEPSEPSEASRFATLTEREQEVLACIVDGGTNKDIARRLSIAPKTVMHHTTSIYRKLGAKGRAEAAAIGARCRVGASDPPRPLRGR